MIEKIQIPIINQDLHADEVPIRAIRTFEYLDNVVDEVFNRIDARIARNMTRISEINTRLDTASRKIESLKGSKKAIRMFSPGKYPVPPPPSFKSTFTDLNANLGEIDFNYMLQPSPQDPLEVRNYSNKLKFFHLRRSRNAIHEKPSLIHNTKSINSLISFVNNENIILNETTPKHKAKEVIPEPVTDTPDFNRFSSIMMKSKHDSDMFHYFPNMHEAPEVELPMDLPDLPGIAGDISFTLSEQDLIVPSAKMNIINDLPNVAELEAESTKNSSKVDSEESDSSLARSKFPEPVVAANIPPPPPPIPQSFVLPPPPPVPVASASAPKVPHADDARSSLMAAIRNAGGKGKAKLRSVPAADEPQPVSVKQKPAPAPAMDLMSDLHAKLALRRKGIAGSKEAKKEKSSLMDKVSSLIPPPRKRDSSDDDSDSTSNDGDWE